MAHSQDVHSADFGHDHQAHEHDHAHDLRKTGKRTLVAVLVMLSVQLTIEIIGGIMSGSLGLLAHATHMITDAVAVALALFAMWIAERPATISRTFGFHRTEVLVVLFNALALWVLASWILYEAYGRFTDHTAGHGHEVEGSIMLIVAIGGLAINSASAWILYRSSSNSINVEGVFWHIMADLMGSIAVVISAVITLLYDWDIVDPILSVVIAALILVTSVRLAIKVFNVLLQSTPRGLDMYRLCNALEDVDGVTLIHDVHAWTLTPGYEFFSAHILIDPGYSGDREVLLRRLKHIARKEFGIRHITIQVEQSVADCTEDHHVDHLEATQLAKT